MMVRMGTNTDLLPGLKIHVEQPGISKRLALLVDSPTDHQLGVLLAIVDTAGSVTRPGRRPRSTRRLVYFGPALIKQESDFL